MSGLVHMIAGAFRQHSLITMSNIICRLLTLGVAVAVARSLGPRSFGEYTLAYTTFILFSQLGMTLDVAFLRGQAGSSVRDDMRFAAHVWTKMAIGATLAVVLVPVSIVLGGLGRDLWKTSAVLYMAIVTQFLYTPTLTRFQAQRRFGWYAGCQVGWNGILAITSVGLIAFGERSIHVLLLPLLIASLPWAVEAIRRARPTFGKLKEYLLIEPEMTRTIMALGAANVLYLIFQRLDVFVLGSLGSAEDVGQYGVSIRFYSMALLAAGSIGVVTQADGVDRNTWTDSRLREAYLRKSHWLALSVGSACVAGMALCGPIIAIAFGHAYLPAIASTRVLLLAPVIVAAYMPYYYFYYSLASNQRILRVGFVQLFTVLCGALTLVPTFGARGAAAAMVLGYAVGAALVIPDVRRMLQQRVEIA